MPRLEDLKEGATVKGVRPDGPITIINVKWHGDSVVELTYKDSSGRPGNELMPAKYATTLDGCQVYYVRAPFTKEPDFGVTSVNYDLTELLARTEVPE